MCLVFGFEGNKLPSIEVLVYVSISHVRKCLFLPPSPQQHLSVLSFLSDRLENGCIMVLIWIFLNVREVEHLFTFLKNHFSLRNLLFIYFADLWVITSLTDT